MTKMSKAKQAELEEKKIRLRELLKPGDTVYTKLDHVSRSGMYRVISLYIVQDGDTRNISHLAAPLLEGWDDRHEGCKAGGCGMDMGFHLVYNLSYALFPDGFECTGDNCPSNDHSKYSRGQSPTFHKSPGYALRQRWM